VFVAPGQDSLVGREMLMSEIALAKINSFAPAAKQANVQPEESIFVLTSSQLQSIIKEAIQPLQDEISQLKATVACQEEKITALETTQDCQAENELNMLRLINDLRKSKEPKPMQRDRREILRALLAANDGKMLAKEARQKMHLSKQLFSMLISSMDEYLEIKPLHHDRRQNVLILK
jgi:hypothetical protein